VEPIRPGPDDFDEVVGLLSTVFPDVKCLRCAHDKFYLLDSPSQSLPSGPLTDERRPILRLACTRCGHIEDHLTGVLRASFDKGLFGNAGGA
jgi:hypothetical protein